jgi:hypothetical protein
VPQHLRALERAKRKEREKESFNSKAKRQRKHLQKLRK